MDEQKRRKMVMIFLLPHRVQDDAGRSRTEAEEPLGDGEELRLEERSGIKSMERTCKARSGEDSEGCLSFRRPKSRPIKNSTVPVVGVLNFRHRGL